VSQPFREDYLTLGLDEKADWAAARKQYRRQVHRWHPDRFAQLPRERIHAEQQFIQLTKAFERVRAFYRHNAHLPFENVCNSSSETEQDSFTKGFDSRRSKGDFRDFERPQFTENLFSENRKAHSSRSSNQDENRPDTSKLLLYWLLPGLLVLLTLGLSIAMDQSVRKTHIEEARKHLMQRAPSEYMPSSTEVNNQNRRGTFVEGQTPGKMGDMLMQDVFRK